MTELPTPRESHCRSLDVRYLNSEFRVDVCFVLRKLSLRPGYFSQMTAALLHSNAGRFTSQSFIEKILSEDSLPVRAWRLLYFLRSLLSPF